MNFSDDLIKSLLIGLYLKASASCTVKLPIFILQSVDRDKVKNALKLPICDTNKTIIKENMN